MDFSPADRLDLRAPGRLRELRGFGGGAPSRGYVYAPTSLAETCELLAATAKQGVPSIARGAGRSYGDAASLAGGAVIDCRRMRQVLCWDVAGESVDVEPGVSLGELGALALARGLWPPVAGGTGEATVGGAVAANLHGKNHAQIGALAEHVAELDLALAGGTVVTLSAGEPDFAAALGSSGLLGVVVRARLRLRRVTTPAMTVVRRRVRSWAEHLAAFEAHREADACVAWIDAFDPDGRGIFEHASYAEPGIAEPAPPSPTFLARHGWRALRALGNPPGMRLANGVRFALARTEARNEHLFEFNYPLDRYPNWVRAYGARGLVQFQAFVPAAEALETLPHLTRTALAAGLPSFFAVLKRHRASASLLQPYLDGYSLALDFPASDGIEALHRRLASKVVEVGGCFYAAKDALLEPGLFEASLPAGNLAAFRAVKGRLDPGGMFASDLSRRLGID